MEKSESGLNGRVESYLGMASITTSERTFETYPQFLQISIEAKGNTTAKNIYLRVCCAIKFEDETNKARSHIYIPTHRSECSTALFVGSLLCSSGAGGDGGDCPELGAAFDPSDLRASGEGGDLAAECAGEHQVINVVPLLSFSIITS